MNKISVKTFLFSLLSLLPLGLSAAQPWKLSLTSMSEKVDLVIDLYEESVEVPTMEMFGKMNGYLGGNIYGVWYITSFKIKDDQKAEIKVANDLGSETQRIELIQQTDSTWSMKFLGTNVVRRVEKKKLVKVPSEYTMKRKQ